MNKKLLATLVSLVIVLVSLTGYILIKLPSMHGSHKGATADPKPDQYAYLTSYSLRSLPPLPETDKIVPTGKVREFTFEVASKSWEILPGVKTKAMTYNGKTPGPVIRVTEGDTVKITLKNKLKISTSIHFHGMHLPDNKDGVTPFTKTKVGPGKSFTYEFIAGHAGTYMYHPQNSSEQIDKGLYGAFIIEPQDNPEYLKYDKEFTMVLAGWNIPCGTYDRKALENGKNVISSAGSTSTDYMDHKWQGVSGYRENEG